jgi:hypothetical protein
MRLISYTRRNWGIPFIIGFILLLIISAVELSLNLMEDSDAVAAYAFYSLVIGIFLQIISFIKYKT